MALENENNEKLNNYTDENQATNEKRKEIIKIFNLINPSETEIERINKLSEQEQIEEIQKNPYIIQFINNPSKIVQIKAIEIEPYTYFWITKPYLETIKLFEKKTGKSFDRYSYDIIKMIEFYRIDFNIKKQLLLIFCDSNFNLGHFNYLCKISDCFNDYDPDNPNLWLYKHKFWNLASHYIRKYLDCIWMWRDRRVYSLDDWLVIKYWSPRQNKWEYKCYNDLNHSTILPKIFWHWENFERIISEKVMPVTERDFLKILHMDFYWTIDTKQDKPRLPYQKLQQTKLNKFYHKYIKKDQWLIESKDHNNYRNATENNLENDDRDYYEYRIEYPEIPEEIKWYLKEWIIDPKSWEVRAVDEFESIYPEKINLFNFIYVISHLYIIENLDIKPEDKKNRPSKYRYNKKIKDELKNIDKNEIEIYKKLAKYNSWFKELAKYIKYRPYTHDLHIQNLWFAMRNWKPYIVILDSWYTWDW